MYAIIKTGGKQYRVEKDAVIDVELLGADAGESVEFNDVLFFQNGEEMTVGSPLVPSCVVKGEVLGEAAGPKVISFKYKRRKNCRRKVGHRQKYTRVKILEITG